VRDTDRGYRRWRGAAAADRTVRRRPLPDHIARLSVEFSEREGHPPGRAELIEAYYGLPVPDLSLYVGFAQPEMFDVLLLTTGLEHLYATLNPSPDLTERQLREILCDHLVTRRAAPVDYDALSRSTAGTGRVRRALQR
jgi:hypothetical protein